MTRRETPLNASQRLALTRLHDAHSHAWGNVRVYGVKMRVVRQLEGRGLVDVKVEHLGRSPTSGTVFARLTGEGRRMAEDLQRLREKAIADLAETQAATVVGRP